MKKSPLVYTFILIVWFSIASVLVWQTINVCIGLCNTPTEICKKIVAGIILGCNCLCLLYFWLNAVKDLMFSIFYIFLNKKFKKIYSNFDEPCQDKTKKVLLLYCTCNDFNKDALLESSKQDYPNVKVIILDDSSKPEYIDKRFCKK